MVSAADERTRAALLNAVCGTAKLTRALLAPADGDRSPDASLRGLLAAVDEGPIPKDVIEHFGFPTACVYGPLAKI